MKDIIENRRFIDFCMKQACICTNCKRYYKCFPDDTNKSIREYRRKKQNERKDRNKSK